MFIEAKDDGSGGDRWQLDYWSYKSCKAPVKSSPPRNQHPVFYRLVPFLSPNQQRQSTEGKKITFHCLAYPKLTWGLRTLSLTTNSSWLPWGGLPCLSSALWRQYPILTLNAEWNLTCWVKDILTEQCKRTCSPTSGHIRLSSILTRSVPPLHIQDHSTVEGWRCQSRHQLCGSVDCAQQLYFQISTGCWMTSSPAGTMEVHIQTFLI